MTDCSRLVLVTALMASGEYLETKRTNISARGERLKADKTELSQCYATKDFVASVSLLTTLQAPDSSGSASTTPANENGGNKFWPFILLGVIVGGYIYEALT